MPWLTSLQPRRGHWLDHVLAPILLLLMAMAAILCRLTEAKSYGYCQGQVVDLGPVMPVVQFRVTEEGGTYLCTARALVFKGSILTYNPALKEAEWVPAHGLANDLSSAEERSAMALANYVLHASVEAAWIARLRAG